jgi:hypothetical protein
MFAGISGRFTLAIETAIPFAGIVLLLLWLYRSAFMTAPVAGRSLCIGTNHLENGCANRGF